MATKAAKSVRIPLEQLASGERVLDEADSAYLVRVLRLEAGQGLELFDPNTGQICSGELLKAHPQAARIRCDRPQPYEEHAGGEANARWTVVQGWPKGDKFERIIRAASEVGIAEVVPTWASRCQGRLKGSRLEKKLARFRTIALSATRQSLQLRAPKIASPEEFKQALVAHRSDANLLLHPDADTAVGDLLPTLAQAPSITFCVGPEGGFSPEEVAFAQTQGYHVAHLGPSIWRTETVVPALLGALRLLQTRSQGKRLFQNPGLLPGKKSTTQLRKKAHDHSFATGY